MSAASGAVLSVGSRSRGSRSHDPDLAALDDRRRRLARAYADGGYSDVEYAALCEVIDEQIRAATTNCGPSHDQAASLFADLPALWERAEHEERRSLLEPMIERVYVDIDSGMIGGIRATPEFSSLIDHGLRRVPSSSAVVLTSRETRLMSGVGMVETGEHQSLPSPKDVRIWERLAFAVIAI